MKVLFIEPPTSQKERYGKLKDIGTLHPSLGLAYVAAMSESKDHEVKVVDSEAMNYNFDDIKKIIKEFHPEIIGMQTFCTNMNRCYKIAEIAKNFDNNIKVILGGAHATLEPKKCLENENIDYVIYGEGEITFNNLLGAIEKNKDFKEVDGLAWKNNEGIIINKPQELIKDISILPKPARHLFPMEKYHSSANLRGKKTLNIITSRGCPFRCAYCSGHLTFGKTHRYNSTENIIKEIKELITKYNADSIQFYDETFTANKKRIIELCDEMTNQKFDIEWSCFTRVNLVDEELLKKMKDAGCYLIFFGLESGVQRLLNLIKKDITLEQQKKAVDLCKKVGIETWGSFILALPTETKEDSEKTIQQAIDIDLDYVQFPICTPFPGTELHKICKKEGKILKDDWDNFTTWDEIVYVPEGRSVEEIKDTVKKAYRRFYLRPKYMSKRVWKLRKLPPKNIYNMVKAGIITMFR